MASQIANDQAAARFEDACHLTKSRPGLAQKAKHGYRDDHVETLIAERQILHSRFSQQSGHVGFSKSIARGGQHPRIGIDRGHVRTGPGQCHGQLAIAAAHIEHFAICDRAGPFQDQSFFEGIRDPAEAACTPADISRGQFGKCRLAWAHRGHCRISLGSGKLTGQPLRNHINLVRD